MQPTLASESTYASFANACSRCTFQSNGSSKGHVLMSVSLRLTADAEDFPASFPVDICAAEMRYGTNVYGLANRGMFWTRLEVSKTGLSQKRQSTLEVN
mgnify:CR=1 FL=1